MPSPFGHSMAGLCGYIVARNQVVPRRQAWVLIGSVAIANLADLDFVPGLLLGDPRTYHHQGAHSISAAIIVGLFVASLSGRWKFNGLQWGIWAAGLYLSHVVLDLLVNDPAVPLGSQLLWPFSRAYFISPITPFARFDYFDPGLGILQPLLSLHNLHAILVEILLMAPIVGLAWLLAIYRKRGYFQASAEFSPE